MLNKWVLAYCSSRKESGLGPFPVTTGLGESAEQVTGKPLPKAQPHCSGLATGLAACCIHLAAVCIPSPSSWLPAKDCNGSRAWGGSQPQVLKKKKEHTIKDICQAEERRSISSSPRFLLDVPRLSLLFSPCKVLLSYADPQRKVYRIKKIFQIKYLGHRRFPYQVIKD